MTKKLLVHITLMFIISFALNSQNIKDSNMSSGIDSYFNNDFYGCIYYMNIVIKENKGLQLEAMYWKSKSYYELDKFEDARVTLDDFFSKASNSTDYYEDARFLYCKVYYRMKKYDEALLLLNQFNRNKNFKYYSVASLFWLGEVYFQLSDLKQALNYFNLYLDNVPDNKSAIKRVELIKQIQILLSKNNSKSLSVFEKANWLIDYIKIEQQKTKNANEMPVTTFLDQFENRDDFFSWLEKYYKNEETVKDDNVDLDDLELQLIKALGGD